MMAQQSELDPVFRCLLWTGRLDRDGYPLTDRGQRAHRVAWESERGPIPPGMELDHLCRRRRCVALHHLELVTRSDNERRKSWKRRSQRRACSKGHSLHDALVTREGGKLCRTCHRESVL